MDFSSVPRALDSLLRRQPPLDASVTEIARRLQKHATSSDVWCESLPHFLLPQQQQDETVNDRWEPLAVGLYLATQVLLATYDETNSSAAVVSPEDDPAAAAAGTKNTPHVYMDGPRVPSASVLETAPLPLLTLEQQTNLCQTLHTSVLLHLEHPEPRVRTLVAKAVGAYARPMTLPTAETDATNDAMKGLRAELHQRLVASIHQHIVTGRLEEAPAKEEKQPDDESQEQDTTEQFSRSSTGALDDTTGWRALETNWLGLASLIRAMGSTYLQQFPLCNSDGTQPEILDDVQYSCVTHVNRHVRAAAISVLEQLVLAATSSETDQELQEATIGKKTPLRKTIQAVLKNGLADNWSQVRMAASVLCRVVFTRLEPENYCDLLPVLLPRMCLNRFYLAQGVKLYSHETWKEVFPDGALDVVSQHLPAICRYYFQMCDADNHVVREAACQAIAELATRLPPDTLRGHVPVLLQALLMCFHDESWPVRDEACLACATLAKQFPVECQPELQTLWERWTEQLTDQIWSVRQDAAVAIGDALEAYPDILWPKVRDELIPKILPAAREQPAMTREEYKAHMNDAGAHTDSQLYSCGSLAPKLKKKAGAGRIGCSNCNIDRQKAPWEATDGCIYLLRELCLKKNPDAETKLELDDKILLPLLTELADVCRVQHFPQADDLRATLWKQLPLMAQGLGKQPFKRLYLDLFLPLLGRDLRSTSSQLTHHAAGQCAEELGQLIGMSILRGRLDQNGDAEYLDRVLQERERNAPTGAMANDVFSPFGPPGLLDHIHGKTGTTLHPGISAMGRFP